jgi:hypothetical protein
MSESQLSIVLTSQTIVRIGKIKLLRMTGLCDVSRFAAHLASDPLQPRQCRPPGESGRLP